MLGTLCLSLLVACEQQELGENENQFENELRVEAEISSASIRGSRTTTTAEGQVTFAENDKIGFYTPFIGESGAWTFNGVNWTSAESYTWADKTTSYDFCAYYPFTVAETRDAITMPDLSAQKGLSNQLKDYDFLVARSSASFDTHKGVVSFTGKEAFKHVYALLVITLKANEETDGSVLRGITLKATNLITANTYHFGKTASEDGMTVTGEKNELALTELDATINISGYKQVFVVNPLTESDNVEITINYARDDKNYVASTKVSATHLKGGNLNKLNILIRKAGLEVQGNTVEDWNEQNLGDVSVEESPVL